MKQQYIVILTLVLLMTSVFHMVESRGRRKCQAKGKPCGNSKACCKRLYCGKLIRSSRLSPWICKSSTIGDEEMDNEMMSFKSDDLVEYIAKIFMKEKW